MDPTGLKKVTLTGGMELLVPSPEILTAYVRESLQEEGGIEHFVSNAESYFDILVALAAQELKKGRPIVFERDATLVPGYPVTLVTLAKMIYDDRHNMSEETRSSLIAPVTAEEIPL